MQIYDIPVNSGYRHGCLSSLMTTRRNFKLNLDEVTLTRNDFTVTQTYHKATLFSHDFCETQTRIIIKIIDLLWPLKTDAHYTVFSVGFEVNDASWEIEDAEAKCQQHFAKTGNLTELK